MIVQLCGIIGDTFISVKKITIRAMYAYEQLLKEPEATIPLRTASLLTLSSIKFSKRKMG